MPEPKHFKGLIPPVPDGKIYLNIVHMEKGQYELHIVNQDKLVKKTHFNKE